jgi:kojibiose phosphorylase
MKDFIGKYMPDKVWHIEEEGWQRQLQAVRESQFSIGNGLIGSRGILEEMPAGACPGTYIAGLYDAHGSKVPEIVNLPNPINMRLTTEEEKIGVITMDVLKHKRYLNLRHGLILRKTTFQDTKRERFDYQSIRFLSIEEQNIGAMQVFLTPLDKDCNITVQTGVDTAVSNTGGITEGRKKHFKIAHVYSQGHIEFMRVRTLEKKISVSYATALKVRLGKKSWYTTERGLQLALKKGQTICLTKIFFLGESINKDNRGAEKKVIKNLEKSLKAGFARLLKRHSAAWKKIWKDTDILIKGDKETQKNLRFNIYHMLISAPRDKGKSSIGARTLSGEGYRGHIFWDVEIFMLPFFLYTNPDLAKNILLYRYKRLDQARQIAKARGFKGAMFPWESADTGEEATPEWAKNLDGSIIRIYTHKMEYHITADIAYAIYKYYLVTGDQDFMLRYGFEMLFETARFWASRVEYNKRIRKYEIKNVIGPDEFHENVNNNPYTNLLARWNLSIAYGMFGKMRKNYPHALKVLTEKMDLQKKEVTNWKQVFTKIYFRKTKDNLIEQFSGFFKKKRVKIKELDENFMPVFPKGLALKDTGKTQLVKQADVLLLLYLLSDSFDLKTKKINYNYYAPRTVHKSSLSPAIHSIIASEIGETAKAYRYFYISLNADLANLHHNTEEGIHAASLGGTWQAAVCGFAGMKIIKGVLTFSPKLPAHWKCMAFTAKWRGSSLRVVAENKKLKLTFKARGKQGLRIKVFNKMRILHPNKTFNWEKGG